MDWIDIKTAKPKVGQRIIAYGVWSGEISDRDPNIHEGIGVWNGRYVSLDTDTFSASIVDVTHWMPILPLPTKGG